jgi:transcriptional regulator with XRE-family HTH domain
MNGLYAVRRHMVGASLRLYRKGLGLTLEDAADVLNCDRSKISRIETGLRGIRAREMRDLLTEYGVGTQEQEVLAAIANPRGARGWWQDYRDVLTHNQRDYMVVESFATCMLLYCTERIPGLLRTPEYVRAVAEADMPGRPQDRVERIVAAAVARRCAIMGAKQPDIHVVLAEAALRPPAGQADVMKMQIAWLTHLAENRQKITIQVLPSEPASHPGAGAGGLTILGFAETPDLAIVRVEGIAGGIYLDDKDDVDRHAAAFTRVQDAALSHAGSAALLRRAAR